MDTTVLVIFVLVYIGMLLGEFPGLALDRSGIALLGAIALLATERVGPTAARDAIDVGTIGLLFGLMVISAQFRLGGCYAALTRRLAAADWSPRVLLGALIVVAGVLSALLANDIVCLAMAPILVEGCVRRGLRPLPFLLALACAANVGSAATLIGNPQNMLIGQKLHLSFGGYLVDAAAPALGGLVAVFLLIRWQVGERWLKHTPIPVVHAPAFNRWQSGKGVAVVVVVMACFLLAPWPREVVALSAAGVLLLSRRMASRAMLGLVDWNLLALFAGLFVVNHAVARSGVLAAASSATRAAGVDLSHPGWLFAGTAVLSNLVSNVPAVMLLLPEATHPLAGPILALSSTLAGNLILVGSIANLIVADQAAPLGVTIGWKEHARVGVPVTVVTLAIAATWLWLRAIM